ncbi:MAG TPA: peptidoglycan DD-metalloendopeptidase family protein [Pyrinomonadaceae bacterium]|nr:peptidoglycan DD-metalloendopeptidase family protein [Pyrinomonadaceae bacterium]
MNREASNSQASESNRASAPRRRPRLRALISVAVTVVFLAMLIGALSLMRPSRPVTPTSLPPAGEPADAPSPQPSVSTTPAIIAVSPVAPVVSPTPDVSGEITPAMPGVSTKLLIPVAGVTADQLTDTYNDARSEGRTHNAIDIIAPRGTPVLAATDGRIVKLFYSERGGITIYQLDPDNRTVYYYAHLDRYADGLTEDHFARRGEVIGYVGDTGNAGAGNYHLHFSVSIVSDPKRHWDGENINPYPLLK